MDRAKAIREAHVNLLEDAVKDLRDELKKPEEADKVIEVQAIIEHLNATWKDYERASNEVQRLEADVNNLVVIMKDTSLVRKEFLKAKKEAEAYLSGIQAPRTTTTTTHVTKVRLPEIKLPTFNGSVSQWPSFWSGFAAIDQDPDLSDDSKLRHLISCVKGSSAERDLEGLRVIDTNYPVAVQLLKDRYGREDLIIADHMKKLQNLPAVQSANDIEALRKLYCELEIHLRGLQELKKTQFSDMLGPILFQKLPYEIRLVWLSDTDHEITDLKGMVAMLKKQVETREQCLVQGESIQPSNKAEPKPKPSMVPTAAALVGGVRAPRKCPFCNSDSHNSFNCTLDVAARKIAVIRSGRCFNCLAPGHGKDACLSKTRCKTCKSVHHSTLHQDPQEDPVVPLALV